MGVHKEGKKRKDELDELSNQYYDCDFKFLCWRRQDTVRSLLREKHRKAKGGTDGQT